MFDSHVKLQLIRLSRPNISDLKGKYAGKMYITSAQ